MPGNDDIRTPQILRFGRFFATVFLWFFLTVLTVGGSLLTLKLRVIFEDFGVALPIYSEPWFRYPFLVALLCVPAAALLIAAAVPAEESSNRSHYLWFALLNLLLVAAAFALAIEMPLVLLSNPLP